MGRFHHDGIESFVVGCGQVQSQQQALLPYSQVSQIPITPNMYKKLIQNHEISLFSNCCISLTREESSVLGRIIAFLGSVKISLREERRAKTEDSKIA